MLEAGLNAHSLYDSQPTSFRGRSVASARESSALPGLLTSFRALRVRQLLFVRSIDRSPCSSDFLYETSLDTVFRVMFVLVVYLVESHLRLAKVLRAPRAFRRLDIPIGMSASLSLRFELAIQWRIKGD